MPPISPCASLPQLITGRVWSSGSRRPRSLYPTDHGCRQLTLGTALAYNKLRECCDISGARLVRNGPSRFGGEPWNDHREGLRPVERIAVNCMANFSAPENGLEAACVWTICKFQNPNSFFTCVETQFETTNMRSKFSRRIEQAHKVSRASLTVPARSPLRGSVSLPCMGMCAPHPETTSTSISAPQKHARHLRVGGTSLSARMSK
jgi:hypothetical protein